MTGPSTIERAFALASSGQHRTLGSLKNALRQEKCELVDLHLDGAAIRKQLAALMKQTV